MRWTTWSVEYYYYYYILRSAGADFLLKRVFILFLFFCFCFIHFPPTIKTIHIPTARSHPRSLVTRRIIRLSHSIRLLYVSRSAYITIITIYVNARTITIAKISCHVVIKPKRFVLKSWFWAWDDTLIALTHEMRRTETTSPTKVYLCRTDN